ncbi:MAG: GAF domain-containing protein [Planctomycetaceae bacterium]
MPTDGPLHLCAEIALALHGDKNANSLLDRLVRAIQKHLDAVAACCWLLERNENLLRPAARVGCDLPFDGLKAPVPVGKTVIGEVAANRTPAIVNDLSNTPDREISDWARREGIVSFACLPIDTSSRLLGVVALFGRRPFDAATLYALNTTQRMVATEIERLEADAEIKRSNEFLQSLVRSAPVAVVGLDQRQNVTLWNPEAERAFGWTRNDVLGRPYTIVPAECREAFDAHLHEVLAGHRLQRIETIRQHADGSPVPVQAAMSPIYAVDGTVDGVVEILGDLTRQKDAERCLRTQLAVSNVLAATETLDDAATQALRATCENLGWSCGELWLRPAADKDLARAAFVSVAGTSVERFQSVTPANESQPGQGIIGSIASSGEAVWHCELSQLTHSTRAALAQRDGLLAAIGAPIVHADVMRGVICFFGDSIRKPDASLRELMSNIANQFAQFLERQDTRASLRATQENLLQSQKMDAIGLLAGGVAHDFNNILSVIIAYSELGLEEIDAEHSLREPLFEINAAGQRAAALTRQLLAFSRKQVFKPTEVDLNRLAEDMDKMLRRLVGPSIAYETALSRPLYRVKADAAQLEQVLLNLAVNARDAMPDGGQIRIETRNADLDALSMPSQVRAEPGSYAVLSVSDTGCGMDEATQARIFEPFFTTKAPGKGTGMGLSTVYGIVQQSGGFIILDSKPGKGTTFAVYLPRVKEALATQQVDAQPTELPRGSETVLVVENEDTVRGVVRRILELRGYTILEARHGGEAVDILKERDGAVDLVLSDILMPVLNGFALAKHMQTEYPHVKLLFMSGYADLPTEADARLVEGENFLQKPFTSAALVRKVHAVLSAQRTS